MKGDVPLPNICPIKRAVSVAFAFTWCESSIDRAKSRRKECIQASSKPLTFSGYQRHLFYNVL